MSMKIVGIKHVDFTPRGEEPINGFSVFIAEDKPENKSLWGVEASKFWVKPEMMADAMKSAGLVDYAAAIGKPVMLRYNRYGKPESFSIGK